MCAGDCHDLHLVPEPRTVRSMPGVRVKARTSFWPFHLPLLSGSPQAGKWLLALMRVLGGIHSPVLSLPAPLSAVAEGGWPRKGISEHCQ